MSHYFGSSDEDSVHEMSSGAHSIPNSPDSTCRVEILEQPIKKVRFRYLSELQGTPHGPLLGERSTKSNKSFPRVRIVGYSGPEPVKIKCWLVDNPPKNINKGEIRPHCHDLVVKRNIPRHEIVQEPHELTVSRDTAYEAVFENMVVLHCVQKDSEINYREKDFLWNHRFSDMKMSDANKLDKKNIRETIKTINKNEVFLYFEAYVEYKNSNEFLCSALSNPIKNLKNPVSGDLKICKVVNSCGPCEGNTEVALFTEKVPPDVKIKFSDESTGWTEIISPEMTHRNLALIFRSPQYPFTIHMEKSVKVKFCLYRESDGCESNPIEFTYQSNQYKGLGKRKRDDVPSQSPSINTTVDNDCPIKQIKQDYSLDNSTDSDQIMFSPEEIGLSIDDLGLTAEAKLNPLVAVIFPEQISRGDNLSSFELDNEISSAGSLDPVLINWSGSDLLANLGGNLECSDITVEPRTGTFPRIEADGGSDARLTFYQDDDKKVTNGDVSSGVKNKKKTINESIILSLIKDILLTKYTNHINCLEKAVIAGDVDSLYKILTAVKSYSDKKSQQNLFELIRQIRNDKAQTLLHTAVHCCDNSIIEILLKFGYDARIQDKNGDNCFHIAASKWSKGVVRTLISRSLAQGLSEEDMKSILSETNANGLNVLHIAVRAGSRDVVEYILQTKLVDVNSKDKNSGDTALHITCKLQSLELAHLLILNGASIKEVNLSGYCPLHISVARNDYNMAAFLIKEKSDPRQECLSLILENLKIDDYEDDDKKMTAVKETEQSDDECDNTNNAFALAQDIMMYNILSGKLSSLELMRQYSAPVIPPDKHNSELFTGDQQDRLCLILGKNERWKTVVKELRLQHLLGFFTSNGFKEPEKVLLNYIKNQRIEILGDNKIPALIEIFKSINLNEAADVLITN